LKRKSKVKYLLRANKNDIESRFAVGSLRCNKQCEVLEN
jgi:hypothetical protein